MSENFRVGTEVLKNGRRGVVIDEVRKSGPNKDRLAVQWVGGSYSVSEWPEELTRYTRPVAEAEIARMLSLYGVESPALGTKPELIASLILALHI
jgi:phytoene/squalene synthetase